jgi:O-antigen ligase
LRNDLSATRRENIMTTMGQPWWLRFSERAFSFNFIAFSFVMFSCWFPTGFSATLSTFAFLFAIPLFFSRVSWGTISLFEKTGVLLFGWLLLSVIWSEALILDSFGYLSEYRIYFMLPVLIAALSGNTKTQGQALVAAILGAFSALVASYGLGLGWWNIDGAALSLGNRIYHGFIMSSFLLVCFLIAREQTGIFRLVALSVAVLIIYNVLNIETGRTGYLQVFLVSVVLVFLTFSRAISSAMVIIIVSVAGIFYMTLDTFHDRTNETLQNAQRMVNSDDYHSSAGYRLEFYQSALQIGYEHPVIGVGVGDVTSVLAARFESGEIRVLTDNVHSEFMNMLVAGGFTAMFLFFTFISAIAYEGVRQRKSSKSLGDALIGLSVIVLISALFNSTIKDYGEKHALIIMLALIGSKIANKKRV